MNKKYWQNNNIHSRNSVFVYISKPIVSVSSAVAELPKRTRATRSFAVSNHVSTDNWALSECMQHTNQLEEYWIQTLFIFTFIWCSNLKEKRKTIVWHFKINYFVSNTNLRKLNWTLCCCKLKERKKPASQKQTLFSAIFRFIFHKHSKYNSSLWP